MSDSRPAPARKGGQSTACWRGALGRFGLFAAGLAALFAVPLRALAGHALEHDLHSHILLIPFVSAALLYERRRTLPAGKGPSLPGVAACTVAGALLLAVAVLPAGEAFGTNDELGLMTASFLSFLFAGAFLLLGAGWMRSAAFPMCFLLFMIPLPDAAVEFMELGLMAASAEVSHWLFTLSGIPVFRTGQIFELPGITLEVAQECSGIRSTWVLFITSLVAANLVLRSTWRRSLLVALVIPLGILRNSLRILVIGMLCVRYGAHMIDSVIHREGGPVFFAITLIPLFAILWWLRRREHRLSSRRPGHEGPAEPPHNASGREALSGP